MNFIQESQVSDVKVCDSIIELFESEYMIPFKSDINKTFTKDGKIKKIKTSTDVSLDPWMAQAIFPPIYEMLKELSQAVEDYTNTFPGVLVCGHTMEATSFNIQKYGPGQGYFADHNEHMPSFNRALVWMLYLNDVPDAGTIFTNYNYTTKAEKGKLLIWPPYFTHQHKGQIAETETKYIATGWLKYEWVSPSVNTSTESR